ncbi:peptide-methionine (S)-S-oxide reductase MsrA [Thermophagus sp. OGC60D27]|uniref:peptide-methionine (S)-S-oxide reductase MsrA n=1 Tax=Thermophagus sp. OGC60D27 TaxID=3458415 RepID=UPI004037967E
MKRIFAIIIFFNFIFMGMTQSSNNSAHEVATLGGGCFWCMEAIFDGVRGVEKVESGYCGGKVPNPTYKEVCSGLTGHAEVVRIHFNPEIISYAELLTIFFSVHDPTTLNRQGGDVGEQYRSVIFYHDDQQKNTAENMIADLENSKVFSDPIVTALTPEAPFYVAEDYHQDYYENNPSQSYCQVVINPKMKKFRERFKEKLK